MKTNCWKCAKVIEIEDYDNRVKYICDDCSKELEDKMDKTVDIMINFYGGNNNENV